MPFEPAIALPTTPSSFEWWCAFGAATPTLKDLQEAAARGVKGFRCGFLDWDTGDPNFTGTFTPPKKFDDTIRMFNDFVMPDSSVGFGLIIQVSLGATMGGKLAAGDYGQGYSHVGQAHKLVAGVDTPYGPKIDVPVQLSKYFVNVIKYYNGKGGRPRVDTFEILNEVNHFRFDDGIHSGVYPKFDSAHPTRPYKAQAYLEYLARIYPEAKAWRDSDGTPVTILSSGLGGHADSVSDVNAGDFTKDLFGLAANGIDPLTTFTYQGTKYSLRTHTLFDKYNWHPYFYYQTMAENLADPNGRGWKEMLDTQAWLAGQGFCDLEFVITEIGQPIENPAGAHTLTDSANAMIEMHNAWQALPWGGGGGNQICWFSWDNGGGAAAKGKLYGLVSINGTTYTSNNPRCSTFTGLSALTDATPKPSVMCISPITGATGGGTTITIHGSFMTDSAGGGALPFKLGVATGAGLPTSGEVANLAGIGAQVLRGGTPYPSIGLISGALPTSGQSGYPSLHKLDQYVLDLNNRGIDVWLQIADGNTTASMDLPANWQPYADFIIEICNRYKVGNNLRQTADSAATAGDLVVKVIECGNEPNMGYWSTIPNPEQYARMMARIYSTGPRGGASGIGDTSHRPLIAIAGIAGVPIRPSANPPNVWNNGVGVAPQGGNSEQMSSPEWTFGLYAQLNGAPSIKNHYDVWNTHRYTWTEVDATHTVTYSKPSDCLAHPSGNDRGWVCSTIGNGTQAVAIDGNGTHYNNLPLGSEAIRAVFGDGGGPHAVTEYGIPSPLPNMNLRGTWVNGTTNYNLFDRVTAGGLPYVCVVANPPTASAANQPGVGASWKDVWRQEDHVAGMSTADWKTVFADAVAMYALEPGACWFTAFTDVDVPQNDNGKLWGLFNADGTAKAFTSKFTSLAAGGGGGATTPTVKIGTTPCTSVAVVDEGTITAVTPAGSGVKNLTVVTANGTSVDLISYKYGGGGGGGHTPTLTGMAPATGTFGGGTSVVITGTYFDEVVGSDATAVRFGGTNATSYTVDSATQITAVAPAGVPGNVDVVVTNPTASTATSSASKYKYTTAPPTISPYQVILPDTTVITDFAHPINISGSTAFIWNAADDYTATPLSTWLEKSDGTALGTGAYGFSRYGFTLNTTTLSDGTYVVRFAVNDGDNPVVRTANFTIVIANGGTPSTGVQFGGVSVPASQINVVNDGKLIVTAPAGTISGVVDIRVTNSVGTSAVVAADSYTYNGDGGGGANNPPVVALVSVTVPGGTEENPPIGPITGKTKFRITGTDDHDSTITIKLLEGLNHNRTLGNGQQQIDGSYIVEYDTRNLPNGFHLFWPYGRDFGTPPLETVGGSVRLEVRNGGGKKAPLNTDIPPPPEIIRAVQSSSTQVTQRLEILNSDLTLYRGDVPLIAGKVTVDATRDERRTCEATIGFRGAIDPDLRIGEGYLWYDKLIRIYRGVTTPLLDWEAVQGTFMPDSIEEGNFPGTFSLTCRDLAKKLLVSKLTEPEMFSVGTPVDNIILGVCLDAGITNVLLPWDAANPAPTLQNDMTFDAQTTRHAIVSEIVTPFNHEAFFDRYGYLIIRPFQDPATTAPSWIFQTGPSVGNIISWKKRISDGKLYNHTVVVGGSDSQFPIYAESIVTDPSSPVHPNKIGDRVADPFNSSLITTQAQAQALSDSLLRIACLEQYDLSMSAIVIPWLEAANIVEFVDPDPTAAHDPTRFFLPAFTVPIAPLDAMDVTANRVELLAS